MPRSLRFSATCALHSSSNLRHGLAHTILDVACGTRTSKAACRHSLPVPAQGLVRPVQLVHRGPKAVEYASKFTSDVPGTNHDYGFCRQLWQDERVVRRDCVFLRVGIRCSVRKPTRPIVSTSADKLFHDSRCLESEPLLRARRWRSECACLSVARSRQPPNQHAPCAHPQSSHGPLRMQDTLHRSRGTHDAIHGMDCSKTISP